MKPRMAQSHFRPDGLSHLLRHRLERGAGWWPAMGDRLLSDIRVELVGQLAAKGSGFNVVLA
jgi:hypothetical protein